MSQNYESVDRQRSRLFGLGGILIGALCATLLLVSWNGENGGIALERRWPTLVGLAGLVTLFVLHAQHKHRQLAALETRMRELAVREATLQARFTELSFLFDTSTQLQLRLDLNGMLDLAAQRLIPCLDAHQSSIMLFEESSGMLVVKSAAGVDAGLVSHGEVKPGEGVAGHVFTTGEAFGPLHLRMLESLAEHCAATVVKTHHHHELLRQVRRTA